MKIVRFNNPILTPSNELEWMTKTVMNPGVTVYNGKFRMVFTAGNKQGNYFLGYAESIDGEHFTINEKPFFAPDPDENAFDHGTVEDPRVTELDGKFYDFSGELVAPGGAYCIPWDEMEEYDALLYKRIIRDCVL